MGIWVGSMERSAMEGLAKANSMDIIETHISWILLNEFAYKIKKPVRFSFLDFSTLERRGHFCDEEVRLNRRLCPDVYLGVARICMEGGRMVLEGRGEPLEYAVKMKRLDGEKRMDRLLGQGKAGMDDIVEIARMVAEFHSGAEPAKDGPGSPDIAWAQIEDLGAHRQAIEEAAGLGKAVDFILEKSRRFIDRNRALMERRMETHVRDCHGDLHSGNIFFDNGIKIIDCIEFSRNFRCIDTASDVAFMAMDLDYHGRGDLSGAFVEEYLSKTQDTGLETLLPLYKCYRANVRAKIAAIEWEQGGRESGERIRRYAGLAAGYAKGLSDG